ncbi:MAG: cell division protein FtsQ/DivIB [Acidobacteriaceae bacterium]
MLDRDDRAGTLKDFYRPSFPAPQRVLAGAGRPTPIEFPEDIDADVAPTGQFLRNQRRASVRKSWIPNSRTNRILMGSGALVLAGAAVAAILTVRSFLLHDSRFRIESSSSIQILGNSHVTRPELLSTFGEDIGRNIFYVPLAQRRAGLESLPWVERATVMRLLPDRLRVSVVERTPIAFVRQGTHIGLVDAHGVLLNMVANSASHGPQNYSFPVVVGISSADPLSTREARMKIFQHFTDELDATGENISHQLSEVDLSEPEDVRALIFDKDTDILVHFGDGDFLDRYHSFQSHLAEWRQQYPHLSSVDMRYPRQVVLEMQPGSSAEPANATADTTADHDHQAPVSGTVPGTVAGKPEKATAPSRPSRNNRTSESTLAKTAKPSLPAAGKTMAPSRETIPASPQATNAKAALLKHPAQTDAVRANIAKAQVAKSDIARIEPHAAAHAAAPAPTAQKQPGAQTSGSIDPLLAADSRLSRKAPPQRIRHNKKTAPANGHSVSPQPNAAASPSTTAAAAQPFVWTPKRAGKGATGKHSAAHPMPAANLSEKQQATPAGQAQ